MNWYILKKIQFWKRRLKLEKEIWLAEKTKEISWMTYCWILSPWSFTLNETIQVVSYFIRQVKENKLHELMPHRQKFQASEDGVGPLVVAADAPNNPRKHWGWFCIEQVSQRHGYIYKPLPPEL